jgi:uncharacterized protein YlxW (UPF0749 family)
VPVAAAAAGLLFATSARTAEGTDLRPSGSADLAGVIRAQERTVAIKGQEVQRLRQQVQALTTARAPGNASVAALQKRSRAVAPTAGLDPVKGPVVQVSLDDAHRSADTLPSGFTADDIVVHQQDVQAVVNALWTGGAEAMMLQDQRVISTSAVRCVGNTLILQGRVYSPPYVIRAIGDPAALRQSLQSSPPVAIYRQYVAALGLGYAVRTTATGTFPAYGGSIELQYARAVGSR